MNKSDIKLVVILLVVSIIGVLCFSFFSKKGESAYVYYGGNPVLTIDLSIDNDYVVAGELGDVFIVVRGGKIKVEDEASFGENMIVEVESMFEEAEDLALIF